MKCEGTKLNDSAGLEGAGLEYRIEELNFMLARVSDEIKFTQLKSTSNSYLKHQTQRKCSIF